MGVVSQAHLSSLNEQGQNTPLNLCFSFQKSGSVFPVASQPQLKEAFFSLPGRPKLNVRPRRVTAGPPRRLHTELLPALFQKNKGCGVDLSGRFLPFCFIIISSVILMTLSRGTLSVLSIILERECRAEGLLPVAGW